MNSSPRPSVSVMAAAVIAFLEAVLILISAGVGFLGILLSSGQVTSTEFPPVLRTFSLMFALFFIALAVFGMVTAIGLIRLRNWARISILIWGGFSVFFGLVGAPIGFFTPLPNGPGMPTLPAGTEQSLRIVLLLIYGLPTVIGAWWLLVFNTKNVKEQFAGMAAQGVLSLKPRPPLVIAILAWLYITTAAHIVMLPFLPFRLPLIVFGHFLSGGVGTAAYVFLCLVFMVLGIGLLKLKPWSYSALIGIHIFFLVSSIVTVLNPLYESQMAGLYEKVQASMHLPIDSAYIPNFSEGHWSIYLGPFVSVAVIALLLYYRRRFLEASCAATQSRSSLP